MKLNKQFLIDGIIRIVFLYLLGCFIFSCVLSYREVNRKTVSSKGVIDFAMLYLKDNPFEQKGADFDCSGYTKDVFKRFKINIPRSSIKQYQKYVVKGKSPESADLVFFKTNKRVIGHVGIYINNGKFIHSPGLTKKVKIDSLNSVYYAERYAGCGKVIKIPKEIEY